MEYIVQNLYDFHKIHYQIILTFIWKTICQRNQEIENSKIEKSQ